VKLEESFVIAEPVERVWDLLEQVDRVARCVPGFESVDVVDEDNSRVRVTQAVGPMTATFDLRLKIVERVPRERLAFTAIGKVVKGAAGNVRTTSSVLLEAVEEGTRVALESDLAMGGVLGSVGQKVIARQARDVTAEFAASLQQALGGGAQPPTPKAEAPAAAVAPEAPAAPLAAQLWRPAVALAVAVAALLGLALARRRRRSRPCDHR
jgi:uncharacterized protein